MAPKLNPNGSPPVMTAPRKPQASAPTPAADGGPPLMIAQPKPQPKPTTASSTSNHDPPVFDNPSLTLPSNNSPLSVLAHYLRRPNPHQPGTYLCPVPSCNAMRNLDLQNHPAYDPSQRSAAGDRESALVCSLGHRQCFQLGEEELRGRMREILCYDVCRGHGCRNVVEGLMGRVLGEVGWVVGGRKLRGALDDVAGD